MCAPHARVAPVSFSASNRCSAPASRSGSRHDRPLQQERTLERIVGGDKCSTSPFVRNTKSWRARAEGTRHRETNKRTDSKRMLNELADIYEQLAEQTEHRARAAEDAMRRARERHRRINTGRDDRVRSH